MFCQLGLLTLNALTIGNNAAPIDDLQKLLPVIESTYSVPIPNWRFKNPDVDGGQQTNLDESGWQSVAPGFSWSGVNTKVWFRTKIVIPAIVGGESVEGCPVRLDLGIDDDAELYIDGVLKEAFHWDDCHYTLSQHAHAGDVYNIAVRGINGPGDGQLRSAKLFFNVLPQLDQYLTDIRFIGALQPKLPDRQSAVLQTALAQSQAQFRPGSIQVSNTGLLRQELKDAIEKLRPIAPITKQADVYYIGHAHIDMNWLWTWPETIDVCHRTWNSAMNLMDQFPDFGFVQSQPGAYVPIQAQFPAEFARMQAMQKRGQWDLVGGLWDESDTNIPSGEGLARSLFLGQRYFKSQFGQYAVTGWLPDSFGHSWQLPQLFQLTGITNFYHMRGGPGQLMSWWEAPDGSRVLKSNADPYNADVEFEQLLQPWDNQKQYGLPQTVVVFGVGDHGGGPTREQILIAKSYQNDPILPRVHLVTADAYFKQLSSKPEAANLPVVNTDLQFLLEGCYTSHADAKRDIRNSENNLYSAEALCSLSSMLGNAYPVQALTEAWKPTAFAQFHDIAAGSAIHSTYEWMHKLLEPAFKTEKDQTEAALIALTKNADTRGPGSQAITVWNTLSFARDDIMRVALGGAMGYRSVVDQAGHRYPAQAEGAGVLTFVARDVPAFGHRVYFPSTAACAPDGVTLQQDDAAQVVDTPRLQVCIDKASGAISKLVLKPSGWNVFGDATDANTFQLLGDKGNTWVINYNGEDKRLLQDGVEVSVLESGPVFARVRVKHIFGPSTYVQDVNVYGALDRVDIATDVDWHDHNKTLKIRMPVNEKNVAAWTQIPYGSIRRPTSGQECPGQKWMDLTDEAQSPVRNAKPLNLSSLLNASSSRFDEQGYGYPSEGQPTGAQTMGARNIPFETYFGSPSHDNVVPTGQTIAVPSDVKGDTLFLLGSCAQSGRSASISFRFADGKLKSHGFDLSDWVLNIYPDNELGFAFPYRVKGGNQRDPGSPPKLWIVSIPIPSGPLTQIRLPSDPKMHLFAATIGTSVPSTPLRGLSVLNDCKYGFDVTGNVFRLTALRSSGDPDPNPDEGRQQFTYSLYPHAKDWRAARTEEQSLGLNIPLQAVVTTPSAGSKPLPEISIVNLDRKGDVIAGALKHSEDGEGYILRLYEAQGEDTHVRISLDRGIKVEETDILERPIKRHELKVDGKSVTLPVGHNQIVTLHFKI